MRLCVIGICEIYCSLIMLRLPLETPDDLMGLLQKFIRIIVVIQFDDVLIDSYTGYFYSKPFGESFLIIIYTSNSRLFCLQSCKDKAKAKGAWIELLALNWISPS